MRTSSWSPRLEAGELRVRRLRLALAVVAGDLGDDLDLQVGQAGELAVADHVVGVQVVLAVGDDQADVGQQRTRLEVLPRRGIEAVQRRQRVEQLDGEAGDVRRVRRVVVAPLGELADAAPRHVAEVVQRAVDAHPPDGVEQHAVTQRSLAERHPLDAELVAAVSRISAPAGAMSARPASSPGTLARADAVRRATSSATTPASSGVVNS